MNASELRAKSVEELRKEHIELLREQFNLRMQKATGQVTKPGEIKRVRRDIARVLTIITEKMGSKV